VIGLTNAQAQAYAIIAVKNLTKDGTIKADESTVYHELDHEMHCLFDVTDEETAERRAIKILQGEA
jgi:hypothetical protein